MIKLLNALFTGTLLLSAFLIFANPLKKNIKANRWFAAFIFCHFLIGLETFLLDLNLKIGNQYIEALLNISDFIIAPIFYLSVSYFIEPYKKWRKRYFLHFSFAAVMLMLQIISFYITVSQNEITTETKTVIMIVFVTVFGGQVLTYCILAYMKLMIHQKNIILFSSSPEKINLKWLQYICLGIITIATFWVFDIAFQLSETSKLFDTFTSLLYLTSVFFIAFHWIKQEEIFPFNPFEIREIKEIITETNVPYESRKKLIPDEILEVTKIQLLELMQTGKPFLDCELSLVKLASQIKVSPHILSYVINTGFNENFYQFINRHRIEEAKKRIINPQMSHLSLLGIAYEVGFNSKTVFNTTFKKHTGKTPTEFKKEMAV